MTTIVTSLQYLFTHKPGIRYTIQTRPERSLRYIMWQKSYQNGTHKTVTSQGDFFRACSPAINMLLSFSVYLQNTLWRILAYGSFTSYYFLPLTSKCHLRRWVLWWNRLNRCMLYAKWHYFLLFFHKSQFIHSAYRNIGWMFAFYHFCCIKSWLFKFSKLQQDYFLSHQA